MKISLTDEPGLLARALMQQVLLENGAINAMEPDADNRYPAKHVAAIGAAALAFFNEYPHLLSNEIVAAMADGSVHDLPLFAALPGISQDDTLLDTSTNPFWVPLHTALDNYFNDGL